MMDLSTIDVIVFEMGIEISLVQRMVGGNVLLSNQISLGVDGLVRQCFHHEPTWPIEIEHAIDLTEEIVMPLAQKFSNAHELIFQGAGAILVTTTLQACGISQPLLTLNEVEALFNRLAAVSQGRPANQENCQQMCALLVLY